jgi:hypothetical protein
MADNTELNAGTGGDTIATDDIAGVKYQRVKVTHGADGAAAETTTATPLPVQIGDGTDTALVSAGGALLVDASATTQPISHAALTELAAAIDTEVQVDIVSSALPTGAATSAKQDTMITALQLIDDTVFAEDAGHTTGDKGIQALTVRQDTAAALGQTDADYQPLITDGLGRLHVNVGNTVTVGSHAVTNAGTFVVQENGAALTALQLIDDAIKAEDVASQADDKGMVVLGIRDDTLNARSGTEGDYEFLHTDANGALWVRHTSDAITVSSHAVTNAGTFPVQVDGAALTALQLIDDPVATLGTTTYTETTTKGMIAGAVRRDADTTLVDTTNEVAPLQVDARGALKVEAFSGETLPVSLASVPSHAVTNAGTFAVQVDGNALTALQLIDDAVFTDDAAFTPTTSKGLAVGFQADEASADSVDEGDFGVARMTLNRQLRVVPGVTTSGGASIFRSLDLDETEEDVKTSAGMVYGWFMTNLASSTRYIKFYNLAAASVSVGSTTPVMTIPLEADQAANVSFPMGLVFDTAICVAATTGVADADTGAPGANEVVVNIFYA